MRAEDDLVMANGQIGLRYAVGKAVGSRRSFIGRVEPQWTEAEFLCDVVN